MRKKVITDKEFILEPNDWPQWPYLPLVKRDGSHSIALIFGDPHDDKVWFVPNTNMWRLDEAKLKSDGVLRHVDDILAEGWEVD